MTEPTTTTTTAAIDDDEVIDAVEAAADSDRNELCERWARWCETRRFYVKPSVPPSLLGRLRSKGPSRPSSGGPDALADPALMALHLAVLGQPAEALDRQVFELYYRWRVANVKAAAAALGISRQHFYRVLRDFRRRVVNASREILRTNLEAAQQLPSVRQSRIPD